MLPLVTVGEVRSGYPRCLAFVIVTSGLSIDGAVSRGKVKGRMSTRKTKPEERWFWHFRVASLQVFVTRECTGGLGEQSCNSL
jgi:hypothetical protein